MAGLSPESFRTTRKVGIVAPVVGTIIFAGAFTGHLTDHHTRVDDKERSGHAPRFHDSPADHITTDTRKNVKNYEKIFGCDVQTDLRPDYSAARRATPQEQDCAKHIAAIIGKNTYGWGVPQQHALEELWTNESVWSANAHNPVSSAFGIPQALTSQEQHGPEIAKTFGHGAYSYYKNTVSQIQWGIDYIHDRYGSPIAANNFWHSKCGGEDGCWY